jgi:hypothetical protein
VWAGLARSRRVRGEVGQGSAQAGGREGEEGVWALGPSGWEKREREGTRRGERMRKGRLLKG